MIFRSHPVSTGCIYNATVKHKCIMQVDWNLEHATTSAILKIEERCFVLKLLLLYLLITLRHCLLLETQHDFTNLKVVKQYRCWKHYHKNYCNRRQIHRNVFSFARGYFSLNEFEHSDHQKSWKTWHNIYGQFRMTCRIHFIYRCHEKKNL